MFETGYGIGGTDACLKQVTGSEALQLVWSAPSNLGRGAGVANDLTAYQVASPPTLNPEPYGTISFLITARAHLPSSNQSFFNTAPLKKTITSRAVRSNFHTNSSVS